MEQESMRLFNQYDMYYIFEMIATEAYSSKKNLLISEIIKEATY